MIKIVCFDIDGTLIDHSKRTVSEPVIRSIQAIRENGIQPVLVSGRPAFTMLPVAELLSIDTYIAYNGGLIVHNDKTLYKNPIDRSILEPFVAYAAKADHPIIFPGANAHYVTHEEHPILEALFQSDSKRPVFDPHHWREHDIYQMELIADHEHLDHYQNAFQNQLSFYPWHTLERCANVNPYQQSKATAIHRLLDYLGIDISESAAIGDGSNDIEMIQAVGVGIAMGNACDALKAVADYITDDVAHDGVAKAMYEIVLQA